jgi:hypothetical protein
MSLIPLKQSTAVTVKVGPALDSTDGVTHEPSLTLSQSDVILFKNFGAGAQKNDATTATYDTAGHYGVPLNTTDTNTVGHLRVYINESGALPMWQDFFVYTANVYDSMFAGSDLLQVDVQSINDSTTAADNLGNSALGVIKGTSDNTAFTGTSTVFESDDITEATADHYNGRVVVFTSGALLGQAGLISDYALNSGRGRFTISTALTEAVPDDSTFVIA